MAARSEAPLAALLRLAALWWIWLAASGAQALVFAGPPAELPPDGPRDVEVSGGIAYVCTSTGLHILDASDPGAGYVPIDVVPGPCSHVAVRGVYAYLVDGDGLSILDLSDPTSPVRLGSVPIEGALDLDVVDGRAYVVTGPVAPAFVGPMALQIIDVGDPAVPVALGLLDVSESWSLAGGAVAVENGVAFVHSVAGSFSIDVTDPAAPALIGPLGFRSEDFGTALAVRDGVLYATAPPQPIPDDDDEDGPFPLPTVRVVDVSNPAAPVELSRFASTCRDIEVVGGVLYCTDIWELRLTDVSDPTQPSDLGVLYAVNGFGVLVDSAVERGVAHVATGPIFFGEKGALQAVDLRVPEFPSRTPAPFVNTSEYTALEVAGPVLYAGTFGALDVFDIRDGTHPVRIGGTGLPGIARDLLLVGHVLYVATDNNVTLLDVTDPAHPQEVGRLTSRGRSLARTGNRLYVGTSLGSLDIYDIGNPAQPVLLSSLPLSTYAIQDIDLAGDVLYAAALFSGVLAVDISDPTTSHVIGSFPLGAATATALSGNVLYAGSLASGGVVLDPSDPTQLRQVGSFLPAVSLRKLEVRGDRLHASAGAHFVFDLASPTAPAQLGAVFPATTFALSEAGIAYTSGAGNIVPNAPLFAIDFGPEYLPPLEVEIDVKPGDRHNRVLLGRPHALVVALLGSASLDVREVDRHSLTLGPDGAHALISVPALVNRDRRKDLLSVFWTPDTGIAFGDTEVCLEGRLLDGRRLRGCDPILTHTGCGRGYEMALVVPICVPLARAARRLRRTLWSA